MADKKGKKGMTLVIAVGPKMPKSPKDTATPDKMKKYGSMPMKKAFELLKRYGAPDKRDLLAALGRTKFKKPGMVEDPEDYKRQMAMLEAKEGLRPEAPDEQNPLTDAEMMAADERFRNNNVRTGEPMDLAFRLLKGDGTAAQHEGTLNPQTFPLPDAHSPELYDKLMSLQQPNKPKLMNRRDTPPPPN